MASLRIAFALSVLFSLASIGSSARALDSTRCTGLSFRGRLIDGKDRLDWSGEGHRKAALCSGVRLAFDTASVRRKLHSIYSFKAPSLHEANASERQSSFDRRLTYLLRETDSFSRSNSLGPRRARDES